MVFSGLVTAWRLAGWPPSRSPSSVNATIDGVVRMPSEFSMTLGLFPSITATHELVVPRSMPMTLPMSKTSLVGRSAGPFRHPGEGVRGHDHARLDHPRSDPPWITQSPQPCGVLAHIGGLWGAASGMITKLRALPGARPAGRGPSARTIAGIG